VSELGNYSQQEASHPEFSRDLFQENFSDFQNNAFNCQTGFAVDI